MIVGTVLFECSSFDCSRTFGAKAEFSKYTNAKHAGEYQGEEWPDTLAGRKAHRDRDEDYKK
ncbi:hypothetical protein Natoc_4102 (plasmid) [Natronococcus occultus SP4]|uniref:C2H2-type domain-containing protein n=1 Tax=Natronococcus occultus SP4 TaxID=694430 RepID=L0K637_9EURY|nr:hypothetical protein Natoc_4102 [Natronococcus occultus SP4]